MLIDRAKMFAQVRDFFHKRNVLEVDCPSLVQCPPIDTNIDVMEVYYSDHQFGYLHTSPEYAMKRLITYGMKDIYHMGHVFRKGDLGVKHSPEFTMIEWYRLGIEYKNFILETCELIELFIGKLPISFISYRDAFLKYTGIDPFCVTREKCIEEIKKREIEFSFSLEEEELDSLLHLLLSRSVEEHLGKGELTVFYEYPASQAALSRTYVKDGVVVAERFEIYFQGVELANGFHELAESKELRERIEKENGRRQEDGKKPYPIDEKFLDALSNLPDCCGVSVGFDRLMMLRHQKRSIQEVLPLAISSAAQ
ncbi:MAG TPA: EF-P lysine aminoacylase EpmA [Chlamydiales bacterium]|nr:EF-P lysine aminoacylase EpmA [Chlamydiales bacterium]